MTSQHSPAHFINSSESAPEGGGGITRPGISELNSPFPSLSRQKAFVGRVRVNAAHIKHAAALAISSIRLTMTCVILCWRSSLQREDTNVFYSPRERMGGGESLQAQR